MGTSTGSTPTRRQEAFIDSIVYFVERFSNITEEVKDNFMVLFDCLVARVVG